MVPSVMTRSGIRPGFGGGVQPGASGAPPAKGATGGRGLPIAGGAWGGIAEPGACHCWSSVTALSSTVGRDAGTSQLWFHTRLLWGESWREASVPRFLWGSARTDEDHERANPGGRR